MNVRKINRVRFLRVADPNIKGYRILAKTKVNNTEEIEELVWIENLSTPNPIRIRSSIPWNSMLTWTLDKVYISDDHPVKVFVNGKRLIDLVTAFDPIKSTLRVFYDQITETDTLDVEYAIDGFELVHTASCPTEYVVTIEVDSSSNTVGNHNILM